jgi:hypothetical protein
MSGLRFSCPRALCGTCSASFFVITVGPTIKNISMNKCSRVFSKVTAFVCIGSHFVAVRTLSPSHHRIDANAAAARANEVGEASIMRFGVPTSCGEITEAWELSLPPQRPECYLDGQPKRLTDFDSSSQAAAAYSRRGEALKCGTEEAERCWNPGPTHDPAVTQTGHATDPPGAVFVGAYRLFAGLVFHQVRPRDRSASAPKQRTSSRRKWNPGPASVPVVDAGSLLPLGPERPLTTAQAASSGPPLAPIVTLLAELARRRLRSLAAKKRA